MFGKYFYNKNIRNIVILFGTVFNDISIRRRTSSGGEDHTFKVPISYGPSKKYLARLNERNVGEDDEVISAGITLPRMSFEITGMNYDPVRKLQKTKKYSKKVDDDPDKLITGYTPVPYNFDVELAVMVKNSDDGAQILEQIMPYFTPEFHVTLNEMTALGIKRDIPIIMQSLTTQDTYEGDFLERRALIHTMTFIVQGFVYGPTKDISLIKEVDVNVGANFNNQANLNIDVKPDPEESSIDDDFGFTTTITDL